MSHNFLIYFIIFLTFVEITIFFLINNLRKNFKWLITSKDENPEFKKKKLKKFYKESFDQILGWDRKKNSFGFEISNKKTFFHISKFGNRGKSNFAKTKLSVFGDSFAFCRYVNDNETWESFLEKNIKSNVNNYGVGNYGLDQSYLKYKKYKNTLKSKIIIFNVVPETIARIHSYWKHYREFGNIMGFKPIYLFNKDKLNLNKILIKKYYSQKEIFRTFKKIKKIDLFYGAKFKKEKFNFPYTFVFLRNFKKYSIIIISLILYKLSNNKNFYDSAVSQILISNIRESHQMYNDINYASKLRLLIINMNKEIKKDRKKMILIISPQLLDFKSKYFKNSINFFSNLPKEILCLDLSKYIASKDYRKFYFKDIYGGHLNKIGNKYIAKVILNYLKKQKVI